ncbi:MAG TPA: response regulator [Polyangiaceae bacterium]|jgi:CheY-like chemotaxis protein|nr:response regulator [Polyangiaceae bacterium]
MSAKPLATNGALGAGGEHLRILVIDDDDIVREVMVDLLKREGHQVSGLPSPIGATKHILDGHVQVVVIDVMMPSMRGDKLAALLSRNPKLKNLGVVLVTGVPTSELESIAEEVNAAAVVEKSELHEQLLPAVWRAVKTRALRLSVPPLNGR